jgi:hypothetical protein
MNTYASQHPADKTPLYESVHAMRVATLAQKRVLPRSLCAIYGSEAKSSATMARQPPHKEKALL